MVYLFGVPDGSNLEQRWGRGVTGEVVIDGNNFINPEIDYALWLGCIARYYRMDDYSKA
jgi:hypothetical protein